MENLKTISGCSHCPFCVCDDGYSSDGTRFRRSYLQCVHPQFEDQYARIFTQEEEEQVGVPVWCPLLEGPVTVKLETNRYYMA